VRRVVWAVVVVAAGFALALVWNLYESDSPAPPEYWIPSGRGILELRSQTTEVDDEFRAGINAYEARDLNLAIGYLASSGVFGALRDLRDVYLASALTLAGQHIRALGALDRIDTATLPQPWPDEVLWIRYTALVGAGGDGAAARLLDELAGLDGQIGELARERKRLLEK
jgi:hypothetical protein